MHHYNFPGYSVGEARPMRSPDVYKRQPVYYWGLPDIVKSFLEQISFIGESKPEVCGILTCGSSAGGADEMFRKALKQQPCTVKAVYTVSYTHLDVYKRQVFVRRESSI